jgi:hypothetical protein
MKRLFLIYIVSLFTINLYSQIDTEFWFAAPDITSGNWEHDNISLCFVTFDQETTIQISQPKIDGFPGLDTTKVLPPNSFWVLNLTPLKSQIEVSAQIPVPYGIQISASNNISVYYLNNSDNSEVYTLKGRNAKGLEFMVPMQYEYPNGSSYGFGNSRSSIEIVATEDDTEITVDLPTWTTDFEQTIQKQTVVKKLNRGWAYAFTAKERTPEGHLGGTRIRSNKPIVVNTSDDYVSPGDLVGDQLVPLSLAGTSYIAVRNEGNIEKVYLFATENNTNVYVNGALLNTSPLISGARSVIDLKSLTTDAAYIYSDKPIIAFQITTKKNSSEPGGAVLPRLECTGSMETVYKPAFENITLNIVTRTEYVDAFEVNNQADVILASDFSLVPGNPLWSFSKKNLTNFIKTQGNEIIRLKNNKGYFHVGAYDVPGDNSCVFGYFSDYRTIKLEAETSEAAYTSGDTIRIFMKNSEAFSDISWRKPDGSIVPGSSLTIMNATASDAGMYRLTASSKDGCAVSEAGYVVVNIFDPVTDTTELCGGDSTQLFSSGEGPYLWNPGVVTTGTNNLMVSPQDSTTFLVQNKKAGQNILFNGDFQDGNNYFESDYVYAGTGSSSVPSASGRYTVWRRARDFSSEYNAVYDHSSGNATNGRMLVAKCGSSVGASIWKKTMDVKPGTRYRISAWFVSPQRGLAPARVRFAINSQPVGSVIVAPDPGIVSKPGDWRESTFIWESGSLSTVTLSIVTADGNADGAGICIDDIRLIPYFELTDTLQVNVTQRPIPIITGDTILCQNQSVLDAGTFSTGALYDSYRWYASGSEDVLGTNRTLSVNKSGIYRVLVSNRQCTGVDSFYVAPLPELKVGIDSLVEICPNEPEYALSYTLEEGGLAYYDVLYSDIAKTVGFSDMLQQNIVYDSYIPMTLPSDVPAGTYDAHVKLTSSSVCGESKVLPVKITVKINPYDLIARKWDNVLALYNRDHNGGLDFTAYQWYRNGEVLSGATGSYLYLGKDEVFNPEDRYSVLLKLRDGSSLLTCDFSVQASSNVRSNIPTMVVPNERVALSVERTNTVIFRDLSGRIYSIQQLIPGHSDLLFPGIKGWYLLEINNCEGREVYKVCVK